MALRRVSRMRNCGVFRDFSWPTNLPDFGRYNLIYGWNGSGKTTLSRLLRHLELRKVPPSGQLTICIDNHDAAGSDFPHATLPIRVFNRDLVNESIFPIDGGDVPPIFVVGKESVDKQKEADRLKLERGKADSKWSSARGRQQEAERALDRYCRDRARVIKDTLRWPGQNPFNNYNKSDFEERAAQMARNGDVASHCLSDSERDALLVQHKGAPKAKLAAITYRLPDLQALANTTSALLQKTVVSAAIQSLKDDAEVADWTRRGLGLHNDRNIEYCMFCQQPLPEGRLAALEAHFSAEYEQLMRALDDQITKLDSIRTQASELSLPSRAAFYDDIATEYVAVKGALHNALDAAGGFMKSLCAALENKRAKAFESLPMEVTVPEFETEVVEAANNVIHRHNQASEDFTTRVSTARERLAMDLIAADFETLNRLQDAVQTASDASKTAKDESDGLADRIKELEDEIIEHRQPAEELNRDLRYYLGHSDLQLTVKDTGYAITRNREPAKMLSEGEMTAIALLYFLKSLEGRDFQLAQGVVVLDDPVSSLDQNAMFAAFAFIRDRMCNANQTFILTHNFMFFRLVREWFGNLKGQDKRAWQMFMLQCQPTEQGRTSCIHPIDPLLMNYDSDYHYLFACLYRLATAPPHDNLETYYSAPSIARRVLESFLAFRRPDMGGHNRLWSQMCSVHFDGAKRARIYRFIQTHMHRDAVGDADEDTTLLAESRSVLNDLLAFMRTDDNEHVSRMIAKVGSDDESESS